MLISTHHQTGIRSRKITYKYWRQDNPKEMFFKNFCSAIKFWSSSLCPNEVAFSFFP